MNVQTMMDLFFNPHADECIISNTEIFSPQDSSANKIINDSSTKTQFETVWKSDIVSVLLTKTNG